MRRPRSRKYALIFTLPASLPRGTCRVSSTVATSRTGPQAHGAGARLPPAPARDLSYSVLPYSSWSCSSQVWASSTLSSVTISGASALTVFGTCLP
jgi:hypothetical protein